MKADIVALGAVLLIATGANAQTHTPATVPAESGIHHCITVTDEATWTSLGLKPDQMARVKGIQENCVKACATDKTPGNEYGIIEKHEEQIKAMLTRRSRHLQRQ